MNNRGAAELVGYRPANIGERESAGSAAGMQSLRGFVTIQRINPPEGHRQTTEIEMVFNSIFISATDQACSYSIFGFMPAFGCRFLVHIRRANIVFLSHRQARPAPGELDKNPGQDPAVPVNPAAGVLLGRVVMMNPATVDLFTGLAVRCIVQRNNNTTAHGDEIAEQFRHSPPYGRPSDFARVEKRVEPLPGHFCRGDPLAHTVSALDAPTWHVKDGVVNKIRPFHHPTKIHFFCFLFPTGLSQLTSKVLPFLAGITAARLTSQNLTALNTQHGKMGKL